MKAVLFHRHGGPDVLQYKEIPDPVPDPGQVLINIEACSINHLDIWTRQGLPGVAIPRPHILGSDIAGTVAKTGRHTRGFKKGDRVIVAPGSGCGHCRYCTGDWESLCPEYNILGFRINGGYAQKIAVSARSVIKVQGDLSYAQWAATPLVFLTAWHMLHTHAGIRSNDKVLIHAAGSGIGSAAIQIAHLAGATVITTVGKRSKYDKALALGADYVINYAKEDFSKKVKKLTNGEGADIVFEHIGTDTFDKSLQSLAKGGRLITCGATTGKEVALDLRYLYMKQQKIFGSYMGSRRELIEVIGLLAAGKLKPVIDTVFPLEEARQAHELVESRNIFGKVVLKVDR